MYEYVCVNKIVEVSLYLRNCQRYPINCNTFEFFMLFSLLKAKLPVLVTKNNIHHLTKLRTFKRKYLNWPLKQQTKV